MALILNARGEPEIPDAIKRRIKALDGGFSLVLRSECWWLMQRWRENDTRWQLVQSGQVPEHEAVDGLGAFPMDMGFDQMPAFIEKSLRDYPLRDLKNLAAKFASNTAVTAPEAEEVKHEIFDEVIKETASAGRVTGRRTIVQDAKGKFTKKKE
jgi:hypothetical protein